MEKTVQKLFTLDGDEGYTIQMVIWSNAENIEVWDDEFLLSGEDLADGKAKRTTKRLLRFLNTYKKEPLSGKVVKKSIAPKKNKVYRS